MNRSEIEAIVSEFARQHFSPSNSEQDSISKHYRRLRDFLGGRTFQSGSYARFTANTPVNDLDVVYDLPEEVRKSLRVAEALVDPARLDIHRIIETLAAQLAAFYGNSVTVQEQPHSIGIYFGSKEEFSIDVVPAISANDGMFWVPEASHISIRKRRVMYRTGALKPSPNWIKSDPKGYIGQAAAVDEETNGRFRKAAKSVKKWRWCCKGRSADFRLKSFHLELAVTQLFQQNNNLKCHDVIREMFQTIPNLLENPQFPDRADRSRYVDDYVVELSEAERQAIQNECRRAQVAWDQIEKASTKEAVLQGLRALFGVQQAMPQVLAPGPSHRLKGLTPQGGADPGEQFLEHFNIPLALSHSVRINARVTQRGFRPFTLRSTRNPLLKRLNLEFYIEDCNVQEPFEIRWKVKNAGEEAESKNALRGEIVLDSGRGIKHETTLYYGTHYVQCYIIKDGFCVAFDHIDVPIGQGSFT